MSFIGCDITELDMQGSMLSGNLAISGKSEDDSTKQSSFFRIDVSNMTVDGEMEISHYSNVQQDQTRVGFLNCSSLTCKNFRLYSCDLRGPIDFTASKVESYFSMVDCRVDRRNELAIDLEGARFGTQFLINRTQVIGTLRLHRTHVSGHMRLWESHFECEGGNSLLADGMQCEGNLLVFKSEFVGQVQFYSCRLGDLDFRHSNVVFTDQKYAFILENSRIEGTASFIVSRFSSGLSVFSSNFEVQLAFVQVTLTSPAMQQESKENDPTSEKSYKEIWEDAKKTKADEMIYFLEPWPRIMASSVQVQSKLLFDDIRSDKFLSVYLEGARVFTLDDRVARAFSVPDLRIKLNNFRYETLSDIGVRLAARLKWIATNEHGWRTRAVRSFNAQPYVQLARVYDLNGESEATRKVMMTMRRKKALYSGSLIMLPVQLFYGALFGYGYSWFRTTVTLIALFSAGWFFTVTALDKPGLAVLKTTPVASVAVVSADKSDVRLGVISTSDITTSLREVPCGDNIEPALYVIDLLLPVVDLGQAQTCDISDSQTQEYKIWRLGKGIYTLLGWILASMALLTYSGVLRTEMK